MERMDPVRSERGRDYVTLLEDWTQVFGSGVKIVDYYGSLAAVLCEAAGLLCGLEDPLMANVGEGLEVLSYNPP
ncbi:hypothetical protein B484DRAFT_425457 [Ochromonadaceae sp. CCMP2298]|nr:hypothetical protein B484DRAFT_425457 [Ochromonadaceae sp. CCMP2298]